MADTSWFIVAVGLIAAAAMCGGALAESSAKPEGGGDPSTLSSDFWADWKAFKASDGFSALNQASGCTDKVNAAVTEGTKTSSQGIVNIAVDKPEDVAKLMSGVAATPSGEQNQAAVATVLTMRTTAQAREAAEPFVAPEAKAQVQTMTANLSNGIQGLPGIYLGDNAAVNGTRPTAPDGYAPVAGASMGCPAH